MKQASKWIDVFEDFVGHLRIQSKELVSSLDGRGAGLKLWTSQRLFLATLADGLDEGVRRFYFLKARQQGVSTISVAIDVFWPAMFPGTIGAIVTDTEGNRDIFRTMIVRYIDSFPANFFGKRFAIAKGQNNRNLIGFTNGSRLEFLVAGTRQKPTWGEGRAYSYAHLTECAKYGDEKGLKSFEETLSQTHPNRLVIYESTGNGFNHWRDMWVEAGRDTHTKRRGFIGWWANDTNKIKKTDKRWGAYGAHEPDGDECELMNMVRDTYGYLVTQEQLAWFRWKSSDVSATDGDLRQNNPWTEEQAFVQSGYSFFRARDLTKQLSFLTDYDNNYEEIKFNGYRYHMANDFFAVSLERIVDQARIGEVELRVWEEPVLDAYYVIGCDPAHGRSEWSDRNAVSVWRCYADRLVQVAEYAMDTYESHQCAWILAHLAGSYRNCMVNLELTGGPGRAVMREFEVLKNNMRAEMYQAQVKDKDWDTFLENARWYLYHRPDSMGAGYVFNWQTNVTSKFDLMSTFRDAHSTGVLQIRSIPLVEEMLSVIQDGAEIKAPGRNKDDRVFAAALAVKTWREHLQPGLVQQGLTYEYVQTEQQGLSKTGSFLDRLVAGWLAGQAQRAEMEDQRGNAPQWMIDRGLR